MEPLRGLALDEVSIRSSRDIYALGKEPALTNRRAHCRFSSRKRPVFHR